MALAEKIHSNSVALRKATRIAILQAQPGSRTARWIKLHARKIRDHRCACSCQMCRNPRRSKLSKGGERLTMQERRASLD